MSYAFEEQELREEAAEKFRRFLFWGIALLIGASAGGYFVFFAPKKAPVQRAAPMTFTLASLPPPPPPPPPKTEPPPPRPEEMREEPQEEQMIMQEPVEDEPAPSETPEAPPAESIGTGIVGDGPADGFGLSGRGSGMRIGGGGGGGGSRSKFGWFAAQVQKRVAAALRAHPALKTAQFRPTTVRIYADSTGRAVRVSVDPTGDRKIDEALREVLTGLQVTDALLGDQPLPPMPIQIRVKAVRP